MQGRDETHLDRPSASIRLGGGDGIKHHAEDVFANAVTPPVDRLFSSTATTRTGMPPSDELDERKVRSIVREEIAETTRTLLGTVVWTVLSICAVLVGLQLIQVALYAVPITAAVGFALAGTVVTGASLYLLYLLYRE
ncbi:hypothetical protein [Haloplanus salilacus]|uniref:hypothetical protein n=1 Tax=Haloplanus salilacus TaxID=2949994 RepID=UPI0030D62150